MCSGQDVYVVGGGDSAGQAVMHVAAHARSVVVLIRREHPAASISAYLLDRLVATPNVHIRTSTSVTGLSGDDHMEVDHPGRARGVEEVATGRLFVLIGRRPHTEWANDTGVVRDPAGYLVTGPDLIDGGRPLTGWPLSCLPYHLEIGVPGSFAAGDVRHGSPRRIASAVGEGAMAVQLVHRYLDERFWFLRLEARHHRHERRCRRLCVAASSR